MSDDKDELDTIPLAMSDGSVKRITIGAFVEQFAAYQRKQYDQLLEKTRQQVEAMDQLDDDVKRRVIAEEKAFLDEDHQRCTRELTELAARGMRLPDDTLQ